jgi:hypothetical protein
VRQQGDPVYAQFLEDLRDLEALTDAKRMSMLAYINTRWVENLDLNPDQLQILMTSGGIVTRNLVPHTFPTDKNCTVHQQTPVGEDGSQQRDNLQHGTSL